MGQSAALASERAQALVWRTKFRWPGSSANHRRHVEGTVCRTAKVRERVGWQAKAPAPLRSNILLDLKILAACDDLWGRHCCLPINLIHAQRRQRIDSGSSARRKKTSQRGGRDQQNTHAQKRERI